MLIRKAEIKDLLKIVEIENLCFPEETAFPPGMFAWLIRYSIALIAYKPGESKADADPKSVRKDPGKEIVLGFIIGYCNAPVGFVYTLDVHPDYRRIGTGSALMHALEEWLESLGAKVMRLEAAKTSKGARQFYNSCGYAERELVKNYYGRGKDAVRMYKRIQIK